MSFFKVKSLADWFNRLSYIIRNVFQSFFLSELKRFYFIMLLKVLLFIFVQEIFGHLPTDYIGNGLSVEDYKKLILCDSNVCILDSERSASYASKSNESSPCLDMMNFACGSYFQHKKDNQNNGFEIELETLYFQQLKEVLNLEIKEEEPKVVKIVKKYFKKCIDPS